MSTSAAQASAEMPPASDVLQSLAAAIDGPDVSLGAVVDALADRALGMLLLLVALPTALPLVPGVHTAFAVPLAIVAAQMLAGRDKPWLPARLREQRIKADVFRSMTAFATPWLRRAEAVARPRTAFMQWVHADRVLAFFLIVISIVIGFPGTGTIGIPGMGASAVALGIIERDGVLALGGLAVGLIYEIAVVAGGYQFSTFVLHSLLQHA